MMNTKKYLMKVIIVIIAIPTPLLFSMESVDRPKEKRLVHLAILVSGRGSNMQAILAKKIEGVKPCVVISNKPNVQALTKAEQYHVPTVCIESKGHSDFSQQLINCLYAHHVTPENGLVCLAGFMKILDKHFVQLYKNKILNIHPSLLPAFPGLNAIGQALNYGVKITGCTVHFVDEGVDSGKIIKQAAVPIEENDTYDTLEARINSQEHIIYPEAIALLVQHKIQ